jgi:hypothetical protein
LSIAIASDAPLGITDEDRLQRALAGDEGAFAWIVETSSSAMAHVCLVVVGDLDLADEACCGLDETTDCVANLDRWWQYSDEHRLAGAAWRPSYDRGRGNEIEFGP